MSSSAINTQVAQLKIGNVQNQADNSAVYSGGVWSLKNSTALTSVTITDSGNVGIGTASPALLNFGRELVVSSTSGGQPESFLCLQGARTTDANVGGLVFFNSSTSIASIAAARTGANNSGALIFGTVNAGVNAERMRIDASGNLLVGTTVVNPISSGANGMKVFAAQGVVQANASSNPAFEVGRYVTTGNMMTFYYGGANVGNISTNGSTITFSGNALSDERWKENLNPINDALSSVKQIQFVEFDYKENKQKSAGVTAQQLQTIPELSKFVIDGSDGESYKAVDYNALIGYLGKAIQELSAKNEALEARLAALESKP